MTVTFLEASFEAKLVSTCVNRLIFWHVDKPTRVRGVPHFSLNLAFTKDPSDVSSISYRNPMGNCNILDTKFTLAASLTALIPPQLVKQ